jgi:DNA-binding transcriptional ArsR family regulator
VPASDSEKVTALIHRATSHPLRRRILRTLKEANQPLAPRDVERRTGEELSNISYHFRVLLSAGLIDLVATESRRGAVKHYYRPSKAFTAEVQDTLAMDRIAELLEEGTTDLPDEVMDEIVDIVVATGRPIR